MSQETLIKCDLCSTVCGAPLPQGWATLGVNMRVSGTSIGTVSRQLHACPTCCKKQGYAEMAEESQRRHKEKLAAPDETVVDILTSLLEEVGVSFDE